MFRLIHCVSLGTDPLAHYNPPIFLRPLNLRGIGKPNKTAYADKKS